LLDLSRVNTGKLTLNRQPVVLAPIISSAVEVVRVGAAAKQITLNVNLTNEPLVVQADAVRVEQIIWNLPSNAVKFTPSGGQVVVSLRQEGAEARLEFEDTGQGITADFLPHIFDMFQQADTSTTRRQSGRGDRVGARLSTDGTARMARHRRVRWRRPRGALHRLATATSNFTHDRRPCPAQKDR
jgi:two-component system CheB/CheR fusion protein